MPLAAGEAAAADHKQQQNDTDTKREGWPPRNMVFAGRLADMYG